MTHKDGETLIRFGWGQEAMEWLAPGSAAAVIIDVLSFTTCVDVAVSKGAIVYPYRWRDLSAVKFAHSKGAILASRRGEGGYSLSVQTLLAISPGTNLVLPSPNGAALSLLSGDVPLLAGCLRNAEAVALAAQRLGDPVTVIAAGEITPDGVRRFALEDWLGAGAVIHSLSGGRSVQATAAEAAFLHFQDALLPALLACQSGQELVQRGYVEDVALAVELNSSVCAPRLVNGAYIGRSLEVTDERSGD